MNTLPERMRIALVACLALLLATCASRDIVRPESDSLRLGVTTYDEVLQQVGKPRRTGTEIRNGETVKTASYAYSAAIPFSPGGRAVRAETFYFTNGVLVGYDFLSSFSDDRTDFDQTKVRQIERGKTTRENVITLLGKPGGAYVYPMIPRKDESAMVYLFFDI